MNAVEEVFDETEWGQLLTEHESRPLALPDDPVALACASYREYTSHSGDRWRDLAGCDVTTEDRLQAQRIRQYYKDRILVRQLRADRELSPFQQRLYEILSNSDTLTVKDLGILHRLGYFYTEDCQRDRLKEKMAGIDLVKCYQTRTAGETRHLQPVDVIFKSRRHSENYEYWFRDSHNSPVMLNVGADNPLRRLIHGLFWESPGGLRLRGNYHVMTHPHNEYSFWILLHPELVS